MVRKKVMSSEFRVKIVGSRQLAVGRKDSSEVESWKIDPSLRVGMTLGI